MLFLLLSSLQSADAVTAREPEVWPGAVEVGLAPSDPGCTWYCFLGRCICV